MNAAMSVTMNPAAGPNAKPQIRMGISAGSYSRNATAGKIGKWISATKQTESAVRIAIVVSLRVFVMGKAP